MYEMQAIVTDVRSVCPSVSHAAQFGFIVPGSFGAAFATDRFWLIITSSYFTFFGG